MNSKNYLYLIKELNHPDNKEMYTYCLLFLFSEEQIIQDLTKSTRNQKIFLYDLVRLTISNEFSLDRFYYVLELIKEVGGISANYLNRTFLRFSKTFWSKHYGLLPSMKRKTIKRI